MACTTASYVANTRGGAIIARADRGDD